MFLENMTWVAAKEFIGEETLAVIPTGSVEQHGPGCPLGTDYVLALEMAKDIDRAHPKEVLTLPPIPFGICYYHEDFPGTVDVGVEAFTVYVSNVVKSLMHHGIRKFLFVNGHGGNGGALDHICRGMIWENGGLGVVYEWWTPLWKLMPEDLPTHWGHGDAPEISLMLHARPGCVDPNMKLECRTKNISDTLLTDYVSTVSFKNVSMRVGRHVCDVVENGLYEDGSGKNVPSAELGKKMYETANTFINEFVTEFLSVKLPTKCDRK